MRAPVAVGALLFVCPLALASDSLDPLVVVLTASSLSIVDGEHSEFVASLWTLESDGRMAEKRLTESVAIRQLESISSDRVGAPTYVPPDWIALGLGTSNAPGLKWAGFTETNQCPTLQVQPAGGGLSSVLADSRGAGPLRATLILLNNDLTEPTTSTAIARLESPAMEVTRAGVLCFDFDPHNGVVWVEGNGPAFGCFQVPRLFCGV